MEATSPASIRHLLRIAFRGAGRTLLLSSPLLILAAGMFALAERSIAAGLPVLVAGIPVVASTGAAVHLRAVRLAGRAQSALASRSALVAVFFAFLAAAAFFVAIFFRAFSQDLGSWLMVSAGWGVLMGALVLLPGEHS